MLRICANASMVGSDQSQGDAENGIDAMIPLSLMRQCILCSHVKARYGSNGTPG